MGRSQKRMSGFVVHRGRIARRRFAIFRKDGRRKMERIVLLILVLGIGFVLGKERNRYLHMQNHEKREKLGVEVEPSSFLWNMFPLLGRTDEVLFNVDASFASVVPLLGYQKIWKEEKEFRTPEYEMCMENEAFVKERKEHTQEMLKESVRAGAYVVEKAWVKDEKSTIEKKEESCAEDMLSDSQMVENSLSVDGENVEDSFKVEEGIMESSTTVSGRQDVEEVLPQRQKVVSIDLKSLQNPKDFCERFYTVDQTTGIQFVQNQGEQYLAQDFSLKQPFDGPKILLYHTHSQEAFLDSVPGDQSSTIVGAGSYLSELLENTYGIPVLHETNSYDIESRSEAYALTQPMIEEYLAKYPSIEVIIDLHRDEIGNNKLLTEIDGKPTARFMFFNGLSYLKKVGPIEYLKNPYINDNLAFSFQLQYLAQQYFPGLTRKIYLKGYRYNLHYVQRSLLVELGAQNNTVEEIHNACEPLAELIARVLLHKEE